MTLHSDPDGDGVYDTVGLMTTTDDTGHYIFDDLALGAYVVAVDLTNLPAGWEPDADRRPGRRRGQRSEPIIRHRDVYVNADWGH